jgi:predicted ribosomally synthesized peptide with SipW-like signal peptide
MSGLVGKRAVLVSLAVILLCMTLIIGVSLALFTDTETVRTHLRAGDLDVTLTRTGLEYSIVNADGELEKTVVSDPYEFTGSGTENVFGAGIKEARIIPGSYFKVDMEIGNNGNVAFVYDVGIQLLGESNSLAAQLEVTVTRPGQEPVKHTLDEMINGVTVFGGEMFVGDEPQTFTVEVNFVKRDDVVNNLAQTQVAEFDLIVSATQSTQ